MNNDNLPALDRHEIRTLFWTLQFIRAPGLKASNPPTQFALIDLQITRWKQSANRVAFVTKSDGTFSQRSIRSND